MDRLYILDSNWDVPPADDYEVIKTDPSMRYYDTYKAVLPQIKEDLVLLLDNDMIIYREGVIQKAFSMLTPGRLDPAQIKAFGGNNYDLATIYDTIGTYQTDKLGGKNKFCPYFFAARKNLLMDYLNVEWGPTMPYAETLGLLTEAMLNDGVRPYEIPEDKNSIYFDGVQDEPKNLGYYHIRSGSLPAYLLATKKYGDQKTYWDYLNNQPKREYLRQAAWYQMMLMSPEAKMSMDHPVVQEFNDFLRDCNVSWGEWNNYMKDFIVFHGL